MTSILKNVYVDKLNDLINEYNNIYHRTIKMKPVDVKDNAYIDFGKEINDKDPKFNHVRISKYKNVFAKGYTPNSSGEFLRLKQLKILFYGYMLLVILMMKKLLEHFIKKNCKKQISKNLEQKK